MVEFLDPRRRDDRLHVDGATDRPPLPTSSSETGRRSVAEEAARRAPRRAVDTRFSGQERDTCQESVDARRHGTARRRSSRRRPAGPSSSRSSRSDLLNFALPPTLILGPRWIVLAVLVALAVPTVLAHRARRTSLDAQSRLRDERRRDPRPRRLARAPHRGPAEEERDAGRAREVRGVPLDRERARVRDLVLEARRGGPFARDGRGAHTEGDFFFPQMMDGCPGPKNWSPRFVDYLFVAFNNSTAFSPTDTPVLSRWAKVLTMLQSLISLLVVGVLASRAVGLI